MDLFELQGIRLKKAELQNVTAGALAVRGDLPDDEFARGGALQAVKESCRWDAVGWVTKGDKVFALAVTVEEAFNSLDYWTEMHQDTQCEKSFRGLEVVNSVISLFGLERPEPSGDWKTADF